LAGVIQSIRTRLPPEWLKLLSVRDKMRAIIDLLLAYSTPPPSTRVAAAHALASRF
jgi:hypothetical protein